MKKLGLSLLSVLFLNSCQVSCHFKIFGYVNTKDVQKVFNDEKYQLETITYDDDFFYKILSDKISQGSITSENVEQLAKKQNGEDVIGVEIRTEQLSAVVYIFSSMSLSKEMFDILHNDYKWSCYYANTYCEGSEDLVVYYYEQMTKK